MKQFDCELGMDCHISRRDLLHGLGMLVVGTMVPGPTLADKVLALECRNADSSSYPPAFTGLRGNHIGSFEIAHQLAREGRSIWGSVHEADPDVYDLVVVGGGISGLSAAHFYRRENPSARILILDNHDDFGGHAKRNEFQVSGRTLIGYGGSQTLPTELMMYLSESQGRHVVCCGSLGSTSGALIPPMTRVSSSAMASEAASISIKKSGAWIEQWP